MPKRLILLHSDHDIVSDRGSMLAGKWPLGLRGAEVVKQEMRIFASARVAVLDNDPNRRMALCQALSELGMLQLLPVSTAEEARMLAKGAPVDLCVVDAAGIPTDEIAGLSGIPPNPFDPARTPAILIAADPRRQTVRAAMSSGYRLVMPAPVVPRVLYRRIGSILQKVRRAGRIGAPELAPAPIAQSTGLRPD